jgi:adenine C2-methylase RlmN of 23S rRNA A2503 and tRNA A37
MYSIHDEQKVKEILEKNQEKKFRYAQIENAIYKNFISDFDEINTLSKKIREILKENFFFDSLEVDSKVTSENGQTTKILFKTKT